MTRTLSNSTKQLYTSCNGNKDLMNKAFALLKVAAAMGNIEARQAVNEIEFDKYAIESQMRFEAECARMDAEYKMACARTDAEYEAEAKQMHDEFVQYCNESNKRWNSLKKEFGIPF